MANLVTIIGATHNPFMPRLLKQTERPPGAALLLDRCELMREKLQRARPDVLLTVGNDHLNQFFMDNMPAFMLGNMQTFDGTFHNEIREFDLPTCRLSGDRELASQLLEGAFDRGVDLAYSNELRLDHSIVVPLLWLRPDLDLPIVPILSNCVAPPLPRPRRFYEVGRALRQTIDAIPGDKRIGVIVSGHLSLEIGGPRQFGRHMLDPEFDQRAVDWVARGDIDSAAEASRFDTLKQSGNMTHGFLNFLLAMGLAGDWRPSHAEGLDAGFPAIPFFSWEREGVPA